MAVSKCNDVENIAPLYNYVLSMRRNGSNMRAHNLKTDACASSRTVRQRV